MPSMNVLNCYCDFQYATVSVILSTALFEVKNKTILDIAISSYYAEMRIEECCVDFNINVYHFIAHSTVEISRLT